MVLARIDRLIRLGPSGRNLAVPVRIDDRRTPARRLLRIVRLVPGVDVDPSDVPRLAEVQEVVVVELVVVGPEARVNRGELLRLRVVDRGLSAGLGEGMILAKL